jgi:hypothetical protein
VAVSVGSRRAIIQLCVTTRGRAVRAESILQGPPTESAEIALGESTAIDRGNPIWQPAIRRSSAARLRRPPVVDPVRSRWHWIVRDENLGNRLLVLKLAGLELLGSRTRHAKGLRSSPVY